MEEQRNKWIDIAKGIAIILMVLGHTSIPMLLNNFIFAFHMPLFFIASGWTTNWDKYTISSFTRKRVKSILIPFFIYSIIVLFAHILYGWMSFPEWLAKGWGDGYPLWFIPVLFFASLLSRCLYLIRGYKYGTLFWFSLMLIAFIGLDLNQSHIRLPWALSTIPFATFMIVIGSEWRNLYKESKISIKEVGKAILMAFVVMIISYNWRLDLCFNIITPIFPLTIGAVAGTYMIFLISRVMDKSESQFFIMISKILLIIGRETYVIVAFAAIIIMVLNYYFSLNPILKYVILTVCLIIIAILKNAISLGWRTLANSCQMK